MRRLALLALACVIAATAAADATAARRMLVGVVDTEEALGHPDRFFPLLGRLRPQVLSVNLHWGGHVGVARRKPVNMADPEDPAYSWGHYDRAVIDAAERKVKIVFSIMSTPRWANGGSNVARAPNNARWLQQFAYAAATRYSGSYEREDGKVLPAVRHWIAWNEPNLQLGLIPQFRRIRGRWVVSSAAAYRRICNAIYAGVHATLLSNQRVACGATAPHGNDKPTNPKPGVNPLRFIRELKKAGPIKFDAWAHHPHPGSRFEYPRKAPGNPRWVNMANLNKLIAEVTRKWGRKRIWLTEYGYQTNPPDRFSGVKWKTQANYMSQGFAMARANPRVDMMLWFLVRDEIRRLIPLANGTRRLRDGWQSGFVTTTGRLKPAFYVFQRQARRSRSLAGERSLSALDAVFR